MNEEEIVTYIENLIDDFEEGKEIEVESDYAREWYESRRKAVEGLLKMYQQEKEKNKKLEEVKKECSDALESMHKENDRKLRAIWLMAREIKRLREYDETWLVEDIVKEYLEDAKLSDDGDHIPRID